MIARFIAIAFASQILAGQAVSVAPVEDWNSVRITLSRGGCLGTCPAYSVDIYGDGRVRYKGIYDVAVQGEHFGVLERSKLEQLVEAVRDVNNLAWGLEDRSPQWTDGWQTTVFFTADGRETFVMRDSSRQLGMPQFVLRLAPSIEEAIGVSKWATGDENTFEALRREGFDFRTEEGGKLLARVARTGNAAAVRQLIEAGTPLDVPELDSSIPEAPPLVHAATNDDLEVLRTLISAGASRSDRAVKSRALQNATAGGRREAVRLLQAYLGQ